MSNVSNEEAKDLKDAGYIQPIYDDADFDGQFRSTTDGLVYAPTLTELIEACGEGFLTLTKRQLEYKYVKYIWHAQDNNDLFSVGKTPEEAVAKLWLALNKNVNE